MSHTAANLREEFVLGKFPGAITLKTENLISDLPIFRLLAFISLWEAPLMLLQDIKQVHSEETNASSIPFHIILATQGNKRAVPITAPQPRKP